MSLSCMRTGSAEVPWLFSPSQIGESEMICRKFPPGNRTPINRYGTPRGATIKKLRVKESNLRDQSDED